MCVPLRTRHRQELPPRITPITSNLINKLKTQKKVLLEKPTAYQRNKVSKLENMALETCEIDRLDYQEKLLSSRKSEKLFKHLTISTKQSELHS